MVAIDDLACFVPNIGTRVDGILLQDLHQLRRHAAAGDPDVAGPSFVNSVGEWH